MDKEILYSINQNDDNTIDLTIFVNGISSSLTMNKPFLSQLIENLTEYYQLM